MSDETEQTETVEAKPKRPRHKPCRIRGCDAPAKHQATGYCAEHRRRHLIAVRSGAV